MLLVDELAHSNVEGSRHAKRWQDVDELLAAGIDVWTTLNVQHLESLNDVIAQITNVVVRETVPDAVIERADQIELIDVTPEELIERLHAGKVYVPAKPNGRCKASSKKRISSLCEKSRCVKRPTAYKRMSPPPDQHEPPPARGRRVTACSSASGRVRLAPVCCELQMHGGRVGRRMAGGHGRCRRRGRGGEPRFAAHRLAEQLGAETHVLPGGDAADAILEFACARNITKIVVGKPARTRWLQRGMVDRLLDGSGEIDVYVIRGGRKERKKRRAVPA